MRPFWRSKRMWELWAKLWGDWANIIKESVNLRSSRLPRVRIRVRIVDMNDESPY